MPPPQSMSVSVPSCTRFMHPGSIMGAHTPFMQSVLAQSLLPLQGCPIGHGPQMPPPQSTPVSVPFLMPSLQVGTTGGAHTPFTQSVLWQSLPLLQGCPFMHFGHAPPPQSVPVSVPFLMPSTHVAGAHLLF